MPTEWSGVRAVLQAGGKGTRLLPASSAIPKPLVPVGGVPMVERLLRQFAGHGIRSVTVITGWLGEQVEAYLGSLRDLPSDLRLDFLREPHPMGNIGAMSLLPRDSALLLFAFGDLITDLDFSRLLNLHRASGATATLASHYEAHRLTLGEITVEGTRVVDYKEKPLKQYLICSGVAIFEPALISLLNPARSAGLSDLIQLALDRSMHVEHWLHGAYWADVNTPEALAAAEREYAGRMTPGPPAV